MKFFKKYIGVIIVMIAIIIFFVYSAIDSRQERLKREEAFEGCKIRAEMLCFEYGLYDIETDISLYQECKDYDVYLLKIDAKADNIPMDRIYSLVGNAQWLEVEYEGVMLVTDVLINGKKYAKNSINENELLCDNVAVYTYEDNYKKVREERLKNTIPKVGMREEDLELTSLGKADKVKECLKFHSDSRGNVYKTYVWRATEQHGIYVVTVRYEMKVKKPGEKRITYEELPLSNGYVDEVRYRPYKNAEAEIQRYKVE